MEEDASGTSRSGDTAQKSARVFVEAFGDAGMDIMRVAWTGKSCNVAHIEWFFNIPKHRILRPVARLATTSSNSLPVSWRKMQQQVNGLHVSLVYLPPDELKQPIQPTKIAGRFLVQLMKISCNGGWRSPGGF